jgi:hypothetical protein
MASGSTCQTSFLTNTNSPNSSDLILSDKLHKTIKPAAQVQVLISQVDVVDAFGWCGTVKTGRLNGSWLEDDHGALQTGEK